MLVFNLWFNVFFFGIDWLILKRKKTAQICSISLPRDKVE